LRTFCPTELYKPSKANGPVAHEFDALFAPLDGTISLAATLATLADLAVLALPVHGYDGADDSNDNFGLAAESKKPSGMQSMILLLASSSYICTYRDSSHGY
jgi:hypothetical protein